MQELDTGKEIWRAPAPAGDSFRSIAYSPDGKTVASGSESGELRLWEASSGKEVRRITLRQPVDAVAFSPDGTRVASGGDLIARLWDVGTGKELVSYPTHDGAVSSFAFSPDEKKAASTSDDGILRLWDVATGKELHEFLVEPPWPDGTGCFLSRRPCPHVGHVDLGRNGGHRPIVGNRER